MNSPFAPAAKPTSWLNHSAVIISDAPNLLMIMKELIKGYGWTVAEATPSVEHAAEVVMRGDASLIMIDDSVAKPSYRALRHLAANPITLATPTLVFLLESHSLETKMVETLGAPSVVPKPLTPSKFQPAFSNLIKTWDKEPFVHLRRANYLTIQGQVSEGLAILGKIKDHPLAYRFATSILASQLLKAQRIKDAETLLLKSFKKNPRDMLNILSLVDFYLQVSMPQFALKLLNSAQTIQPMSVTLAPDLMMTHLMLGNLQAAIKTISQTTRGGSPDEKSLSFLARLLLAEGQRDEAERLLSQSRTLFKKIETAWLAVEFNNHAVAS